MGMNILARRVWVCKILHNIRLKAAWASERLSDSLGVKELYQSSIVICGIFVALNFPKNINPHASWFKPSPEFSLDNLVNSGLYLNFIIFSEKFNMARSPSFLILQNKSKQSLNLLPNSGSGDFKRVADQIIRHENDLCQKRPSRKLCHFALCQIA